MAPSADALAAVRPRLMKAVKRIAAAESAARAPPRMEHDGDGPSGRAAQLRSACLAVCLAVCMAVAATRTCVCLFHLRRRFLQGGWGMRATVDRPILAAPRGATVVLAPALLAPPAQWSVSLIVSPLSRSLLAPCARFVAPCPRQLCRVPGWRRRFAVHWLRALSMAGGGHGSEPSTAAEGRIGQNPPVLRESREGGVADVEDHGIRLPEEEMRKLRATQLRRSHVFEAQRAMVGC
jgi:hypothetical protein